MNERELFLSALEFEDPAARRALLQSACADDAKLLARVEALLASHEGQTQFLSVPAVEQLGDDAGGDSNVTVLFGAVTTADDEVDMDENDNETALDFLEPTSRPDSLGRLAHYEILEVLGRGAFGTVLKAFDEKLQRIVAIKVLSPQLAAASPARKRFLREARSSAKVRHENVVSIYNVEDEPIPYLVMEHIPGETLQRRLDEHGPLDLPDVLWLGKQIADGLAAAHAQDLIHRDVKPGNVLLDTSVDDRVKITDFGLARTVDDASMTQSGMIAGTPLYMAPEQALGRKLDQRADLFSFGSVLYHMLSGRPPFRARSTVGVLKRVAEDTPRPIQEIIPEVPDWMCEIVSHLHAKNPDKRYGSAKEVSRLLASCLADVQQGRLPCIAAPGHPAEKPAGRVEKPSVAEKPRPGAARRTFLRPVLRIAALVLVVLFAGLVITEATHVSHLATTVIRLATGSGVLVIETDDPGIQVTVTGDGQEIKIREVGVEQLTLRPGQYRIAAFKDGKRDPFKQQTVTITRNGRKLVQMRFEPQAEAESSIVAAPRQPAPPPPAQWPADAPPLAGAPFNADQAKQHQQAWADYLGVPAEISNSIGMKLRLIPPGRFQMRPGYHVTISRPFRIGSCEVTIAQFRAFVDDTGYKTSAEELGHGQHISQVVPRVGQETDQRAEYTWRHKDVNRGDNYPVAQLSWIDAAKFCNWLSGKEGKRYRLPTEAQWEWACRAGSLSKYCFGDDRGKLNDYAWYAGNSQGQAHPVGLKQPNPWGLFDLHGNVCEYCRDWHAKRLPGAQVSDPGGPADGRARVTRGGGYIGTPQTISFDFRGCFEPSWSLNHFGFRVVCEVDEPAPDR